jgi:hypothetical protein
MNWNTLAFVAVALLIGAYLGKKFPQANLIGRFLP